MDLETILFIVSGILTVAGTLLGGKWLKAKGKLGQLKSLGKEAIDVLIVAVDAVEDDKITKDETDRIVKEAKEVAVHFKALIGK